jgi:phospholipid/cholesterol/gamma-HCH transport system ATP-binding protein
MKQHVIIQVKNLIARFHEHIILDRISFEVYQGEILVIVGESGCGKSTLLKHLIGLYHPPSGQVLIEGEDITTCDEVEFQKVLRKIGVLYQGSALLSSMTLSENVALPIQEYTDLPHDSIDTMVKMKLTLVNLGGYEHYLPSEISGGMKKRAALARAMALNPTILFFDEPSAGLDPLSSAELDNLIITINRNLGTTMVIVTHELHSIFAVAHRVIMLDARAKGIIAEGNPHELRDKSTNPFVRQFFNRQLTHH